MTLTDALARRLRREQRRPYQDFQTMRLYYSVIYGEKWGRIAYRCWLEES